MSLGQIGFVWRFCCLGVFFSFPSFQTAEGLTFSNSAFISHLKRAASCTVLIMSLCYIIGCSEYTHTHTHTHVEKWGHVRVVNNRNMNFKDFVKCCLTPWSSFLHVNFSPLIPQSGLKDLGFFSSLSFLKKITIHGIARNLWTHPCRPPVFPLQLQKGKKKIEKKVLLSFHNS